MKLGWLWHKMVEGIVLWNADVTLTKYVST